MPFWRGALWLDRDVDVTQLTIEDAAAAVALWEACGLTRPWNDADADFRLALDGPSSTVLGVRAEPAREGRPELLGTRSW